MQGDLNEIFKIEIHDFSGQKIIDKEVTNENEINVSELSQGMYILLIHSDFGLITKKLIKE